VPLLALALAPGIAGCASAAPRARLERTPMPPVAGRSLPFSEAVRVGDLLFLSGAIGTLPGTLELAPGGIGPETRQTMENLGETLSRHGATWSDVVRCTVMLADMAEWGAMNEVYVTFFPPDALPARSALGASGLALGARVEIECLAAVPPG
jgi:reactive intermediate/imine deaminase